MGAASCRKGEAIAVGAASCRESEAIAVGAASCRESEAIAVGAASCRESEAIAVGAASCREGGRQAAPIDSGLAGRLRGRMPLPQLRSFAAIALLVAAPIVEAADCVVLLHGLGRTVRSMHDMADALEDAGYSVVNDGYPSRKLRIAELAGPAVGGGAERCRQKTDSAIHFVTQSMGGILVRHYLEMRQIPELGRVVMLGPPNHGSEVVDRVRRWPGYSILNGKAGHELGTGPDSVPRSLGPARFEVGIIAGSRTINLILSQFLPNPDDGKVSVESTRLAGMRDHIVVPVSHPFLAERDVAIEQVLEFLETGQFDHDAL